MDVLVSSGRAGTFLDLLSFQAINLHYDLLDTRAVKPPPESKETVEKK